MNDSNIVSIVDNVFEALKKRSRYLTYEDDGNDDRYVNVEFIEQARQELKHEIKAWMQKENETALYPDYYDEAIEVIVGETTQDKENGS